MVPERGEPAAAAAAPQPAPAVEAPAVTTTDHDDDADTTDADTTEAATTEPGDTEADTTEPEDTAFGDGGVETDPARREWLEFVEDADPDSFAGGADLEDIVDGNRMLMIGDSVMASTASRYGGEMCNEVVTSGWDVEVDAETGRFIDFGDKVLDDRLAADFDVVVIMLGNNYGANPGVYEEYLRDLVDRLDDRPVVLSTVTVFQANRTEVNDIIYDIAQDHDNIRVLDWAGETEKNPALTGGDGLHLSDLGRARFAGMVAEELGDAPNALGEGDCLRSSFTDDSAGTGNTGPVEGQVTMPPNSVPSNTSPGTTPTTFSTVPGTVEPTVPETTAPGGGTVGETTPPTVPATAPPTEPVTQPTTPPTQATPPPTVATVPPTTTP